MSCFVDLVRPRAKWATRLFDVGVVIAGSFCIAFMAQLTIPLWFTPVPLSMQTFAILLLAGALGTKRALWATVLYLAEGLMGLPVFTGFTGGLSTLMGPRGGYLFGFVLCTYVVATLLESGCRKSVWQTFFAMVLGNALLYVSGALYLSLFVGGLVNAFALGVYPFLLGDLLKITAACLLIPSGWKWVNSKLSS